MCGEVGRVCGGEGAEPVEMKGAETAEKSLLNLEGKSLWE